VAEYSQWISAGAKRVIVRVGVGVFVGIGVFVGVGVGSVRLNCKKQLFEVVVPAAIVILDLFVPCNKLFALSLVGSNVPA
jgi:hypothetical protein